MIVELNPSRLAGDPATLLEAIATELGLVVRLRSTLATYPGSIHWHFQRPGERGTLELTWWPSGGRLWLKVHPMRSAPWIEGCVAEWVARLP